MRILAVDNEAINLARIAHSVQQAGFHNEYVNDGNTAFDKLVDGCYDLVIVGLEEPTYNGWQLLYEIRDPDSGLSGLKVIMIAKGTTENAVKAWSLGAEFVGKPHFYSPLVETIRKVAC